MLIVEKTSSEEGKQAEVLKLMLRPSGHSETTAFFSHHTSLSISLYPTFLLVRVGSLRIALYEHMQTGDIIIKLHCINGLVLGR